jgi:hypothetical protein
MLTMSFPAFLLEMYKGLEFVILSKNLSGK